MTVRSGAAVTRNMLHHRQNPVVQQPFGHRLCDGSNRSRALAIGAVADDAIRTLHQQIGNRQTIDVNAYGNKISCNQASSKIGGPATFCSVLVVKLTVYSTRG